MIGMLLGSGIEFGIGIDAQPVRISTVSMISTINKPILGLSFNFEYSPVYLYDLAQYKGFCDAFPAVSKDP